MFALCYTFAICLLLIPLGAGLVAALAILREALDWAADEPGAGGAAEELAGGQTENHVFY